MAPKKSSNERRVFTGRLGVSRQTIEKKVKHSPKLTIRKL
jgi:hypothetical protein